MLSAMEQVAGRTADGTDFKTVVLWLPNLSCVKHLMIVPFATQILEKRRIAGACYC